MTTRLRILLGSAAVVVPVLLIPATAQPKLGIALCIAAILMLLASQSIAYPVALSGLPVVVIALLGHSPFPHGTLLLSIFVWTTAAVLYGTMFAGKIVPFASLMSIPVIGSAALLILMLMRLGVSPDPTFGAFKIKLFILINLTFLVAGIAVGRRRADFDRYVLLSLVVTTLSGLVLVQELAAGQALTIYPGRVTISPEENPIWLGRAAAEGTLLAVYLILTSGSRRLRLFAMAALPPLAVAVTASGSRGPILALVVGLVAMLVLLLQEPASRRRFVSVAAGIVAAALLVGVVVPGSAVSRSFSVLTGGVASSNGRSGLWDIAVRLFAEHPLLGIGPGGFAHFSIESYPHNIFLETLAELGLVGFAILVLVIASSVLGMLRLRASGSELVRHWSALVFGLFALSFVDAQLSGDISSNGPLWLTFGLTLGLLAQQEKPADEPDRQFSREAISGAV